MQTTYSSEPLEKVAYFDHGDGTADVYLRRDVRTEEASADDGAVHTFYAAEEARSVTDKPKAWFSVNFDEAWGEFERSGMSEAERILDLEAQIDEQAAAINELAVIMAGGE